MKVLFLLFACAVVPKAAFAGSPFVTDDPQPTDYRHWELYLDSQVAHTDGLTFTTLPEVETNYGALPNVQLHLELHYVLSHVSGLPAQSGLGDTELGIKYRFIDLPEAELQVAVFPLFEVPTGSADRGLGAGQVQFFLPLWIQKNFGNWATYGGGGWWYNPGPGNLNFARFGWVVEPTLSETLTLGVEIYHQTPTVEGGSSITAFNVGGYLKLGEHSDLLVSAGRDFGTALYFLSYVGVLLAF